jgi:hypothetical protein
MAPVETATASRAAATAEESTTSTVVALENEYRTPFDRMRRDRDRRNDQIPVTSTQNSEETQTFWQRLVAGVRHFLGFETV